MHTSIHGVVRQNGIGVDTPADHIACLAHNRFVLAELEAR
jgi:hypothetical protein